MLVGQRPLNQIARRLLANHQIAALRFVEEVVIVMMKHRGFDRAACEHLHGVVVDAMRVAEQRAIDADYAIELGYDDR